MRLKPRPSHAAIVIGGAATVLGSLPGMLTGALAPELSVALSFSVAGLGTAIAIQNSVGVLAAVPLGHVVDRLGATRSIRLAMLTIGLIALSIAFVARSYTMLVVLLALGSVAKRLIEPASNRLLINNVGLHRLGLAFGLKQSAPPAAVMLAGLSVPVVAAVWGWQAAFVITGLLALTLAGTAHRRPRPAPRPTSRGSSSGPRSAPHATRPTRQVLILLSVAFGFANGASVTVPVFYVSSAVAAGAAPGVAGAMLGTASATAIVVRLALGVITDRLVHGHLLVCAVMLATGAVGFGLLASGQATLVVIGVLLALGGAWGFSGMFWFTMVRANPTAPGEITGKIAPGALIANSVSPLIFGIVADRYSYGLGWAMAATMALLAAVGMYLGDRRMARVADPT